MLKIGLDMPKAAIAHNMEDAHRVQETVGYPTIIRPSFTMGGSGGGVAYNKEQFIEICLFENNGYYRNNQPIGKSADFITAPEISQLFGEILGLYIYELWQKHLLCKFNLIELGPGKGTLLEDILRINNNFKIFLNSIDLNLIEINKELIKLQKKNLSKIKFDINNIQWSNDIDSIELKPSIIFANEFFDCFAIKQFIKIQQTWHEKKINFNKKDTGIAALKVLKKNGVEVQEAYPGCCGMPFLEQADLSKVVEQAKKVSKDLLEWVDKGYRVITLTSSCGLMLKFEWPLLLPNDENVKKLSKNVSDIDEYIVDISDKEGLAEGLGEIDGGVTVHHACHARAQNMGIKARDMLKLIPNIKIDVVERCAGHGGTFGVMKETHNLALKVGRPTARQIKNKNNKYMVSDCPLAAKHLKQLEQDTKISNDEALHPIELLARAYKL